jgi:hypothetical protein
MRRALHFAMALALLSASSADIGRRNAFHRQLTAEGTGKTTASLITDG